MNTSTHGRRDTLVAFFALTFAITWGLAALIVLFPRQVEALFGALSAANPLFIIAVAGPTIAATILTFKQQGWPGLRRLYAQLKQWRFGLRWYAVMLIAIPLVSYLVSRVAGPERPLEFTSLGGLLGYLLLNLLLGPLGEELGWHGFAFPRLLERFSPLVASLVFGLLWGVWHLPAFFLAGLPQAELAIPVFLVRALFVAILATWIFVRTGGNVPSMVLLHYIANITIDLFGVPHVPLMVVTGVAALLVVLLDRRVGWLHKHQAEARRSTRLAAPFLAD